MGYYKQQLIDQEEDLIEELQEVQTAMNDSVDRGESREERTHLMAREIELEGLQDGYANSSTYGESANT